MGSESLTLLHSKDRQTELSKFGVLGLGFRDKLVHFKDRDRKSKGGKRISLKEKSEEIYPGTFICSQEK